MRVVLPFGGGWRAVIAVAALYALVVQMVLGGAARAEIVDPTGIICLAQADGSGHGPAEYPPFHLHLSCCTAAHVAPAIATPDPVSATIAWPVRRSQAVSWRREVGAAPRAPPLTRAHARAPPVA